MNLIKQIEIKNFRSFGNRKKESYKVVKVNDLNILSGANDSGKSNILRALNLFFNGQTNLNQFFDFDRDFFRREWTDGLDVKEELVTVKIWFHNEKNKDKNKVQETKAYLPENFWVSKKWKKTSQYSSSDIRTSIEIEFEKEKGNLFENFLENPSGNSKVLKSHYKAGLQKQLTDFLNSIQYHYVPAIKDRNYFSHLFGELQETLWKTKVSKVEEKKVDFETAIQEETDILMREFRQSVLGNDNQQTFTPVFQLPADLINLFRALVVQTGNVDLTLRGDGLQAKLIPEILNFISKKELSFTSRSIKSAYKAKKYFIWGFEEPENSYEYKNAQILADKFRDSYHENAQIFLTTHSFNFLSLNGKHVSKYRIWKDKTTESSRISKLKEDQKGNLKFESSNDFKSDWKQLEEELGFFHLNNELKKLFDKQEESLKILESKILSIDKPIVYSEGLNMNYLKKAKEFFLPHIDIDFEDLGGKTELKQMFLRLSRTNYSRFKMFFVFDCDATGEFQACHRERTDFLIPFIFERNSDNKIEEVQSGIENLFREDLFDDEILLFDVNEHRRNGVLKSRVRKLRKSAFENYILGRDQSEDFNLFGALFEFLDKEINRD